MLAYRFVRTYVPPSRGTDVRTVPLLILPVGINGAVPPSRRATLPPAGTSFFLNARRPISNPLQRLVHVSTTTTKSQSQLRCWNLARGQRKGRYQPDFKVFLEDLRSSESYVVDYFKRYQTVPPGLAGMVSFSYIRVHRD